MLLTSTYIWHPTPISVPGSYWLKVSGAGTAQIVGTILLLKSFRERDFAVGTVYSKAEILLVAIASTLILKEAPSLPAWIAIVVCMVGLVTLTAKKSAQSYYSLAAAPGVVRGMSAGLFFGLAAVGIRSSVTTLAGSSIWHRSVFTLATMLGIQALLHGLYLFYFAPDQLRKIFSNWRRCVLIGLMSVSGTTGWTVAMAM
ncbi:MAG: EamA family transporter, partial [Acidimicrobiales bacterium]